MFFIQGQSLQSVLRLYCGVQKCALKNIQL